MFFKRGLNEVLDDADEVRAGHGDQSRDDGEDGKGQHDRNQNVEGFGHCGGNLVAEVDLQLLYCGKLDVEFGDQQTDQNAAEHAACTQVVVGEDTREDISTGAFCNRNQFHLHRHHDNDTCNRNHGRGERVAEFTVYRQAVANRGCNEQTGNIQGSVYQSVAPVLDGCQRIAREDPGEYGVVQQYGNAGKNVKRHDCGKCVTQGAQIQEITESGCKVSKPGNEAVLFCVFHDFLSL